MIQSLTEAALVKWHQTSDIYMPRKGAVSFEKKQRNEAALDTFLIELSATVRQIPNRFANRKKWKKKILLHARKLEATVSPTSNPLEYFLELGYGTVTTAFIHKVREFDSTMDIYDTFQAIRNVWIMNSIQILFEMEVKLTPAIFAYSMMYPYSDNYLDDPTISMEEKKAFNQRFKNWLIGIEDKPLNEREEKLYQLVQLIETEFDRSVYPEVYTSLLAIHAAQEKSLVQQDTTNRPTEKDVFAISFEKGGTSVLADACLVRGKITEEEAAFVFDYGVLLQLIDDLQDVEEDQASGHQTIFSPSENKTHLDALTTTLMNFIEGFYREDKCFTTNQGMALKQVIGSSALRMLDEAVAQNEERFSKEYYAALDASSLISFVYLTKTREKVAAAFSAAELIKLVKVLGAK